MRRALLFLFVSALLPAQDAASKIDQYVQAHVKQGRFMGSVLAAKGGTVILSKGYGMANMEWAIPNTPQTKFRLGSITKQFTATAILQLAEQGKLSPDDKIGKYVDDAPAAWKDVTIHHLLTHTGGVPNFTSFPDYRRRMRETQSPTELIARFKDKPLDFEPGSKHSYSNSGYVLLGHVIEKASGEKYEDYLKRHVFGVLDMQDSGYDHDTVVIKRRATGYSTGRDGNMTNSVYLDMSIPHGAGALYSTVEDLYRWDRALYTTKILSKTSMEKMFTPFLNNYAYGWSVSKTLNRKSIGHGGGINGFNTMIARYPDDDAAVIVLGNLEGPASGRIARDVAAILFGEPYEAPKERTFIQLDPKLLDRYTGKFQLGSNVFHIKRDGNNLTGGPENQQISLAAESETKFYARQADAEITFTLGADGRASEMVLRQPGRTQQGKRID